MRPRQCSSRSDPVLSRQVLTQLLEIVRKRDTFEPILPEMIMADGEGEISLRKDDFRPAATSSAFLPPEAAAWTAQPELSQREAAYAWNMGMVVYTLLAGCGCSAHQTALAASDRLPSETSQRKRCMKRRSPLCLHVRVGMPLLRGLPDTTSACMPAALYDFGHRRLDGDAQSGARATRQAQCELSRAAAS